MDHGWLIFLDHNVSTMYVQRPDGTPAYTATVRVPSGARPSLMDAAIDAQGRAAVGIAYPGGESGFEGSIVLLDPSGNQTAIYSTGRYLPSHLCFDPDGAIWTAGWQRDLVKMDMEDEQDYAVIRRFNARGEQTGAFVKRSTFPFPGLQPGAPTGGRWGIRWSRDRIGAYVESGQTSERMVWLELDRSGKEVGRWTLDGEHANGLAFAGGELYSAVSVKKDETTWVSNLVKLDRATGHWQALSSSESPEGWGIVMDADGDQIVLAMDHGRTYQWVKP
jgi:sugar lactone lactonase YvrE